MIVPESLADITIALQELGLGWKSNMDTWQLESNYQLSWQHSQITGL